MNYALNKPTGSDRSSQALLPALKKLMPFLQTEWRGLSLAMIAILFNSGLNLIAPLLIGHVVDAYIITKQYQGIVMYSAVLLVLFVIAYGASILQTRLMGAVGQRILFRLRSAVFNKLQELPVAFFNQNQAGDLISRINSDTDRLNQLFSQTLQQAARNIFVIIGAGIFLVVLHPLLGLMALLPAALLFLFTRATAGWIKRMNAVNLKAGGSMSAEIQESLDNFKVIVAFNRRDYFRQKFQDVNEENYATAMRAGYANNIFTPIYGLASNVALLIVLVYGILLITQGNFTVGLLISFLAYANNFYDPLRFMASMWSTFQIAMGSWDRIAVILDLQSDMPIIEAKNEGIQTGTPILEFRSVSFHYPDGSEVLHDVHFSLERGKTYALVGPTGGGKTTTASLMARLYDPSKGTVLLSGRDIRSVSHAQRTNAIGFILQEPFLFSGTVGENLTYGTDRLAGFTQEQLQDELKQAGLDTLLNIFGQGLQTPVMSGGESISLGQRQLLAFMHAVLRKPDLLILDEATANIDTVTEQLLEDVLKKLPKDTTRVIIAHRLNTIENADEIFFVSGGRITLAGSLDHAVEMLLHGKRMS